MTGLKITSSPQLNVSDCGAACQGQAGPPGFSGFVAGLNLADLVQLACLENRDRKLVVLSGHRSAQLFFSKGEVVHCETGDKTGEDAFYEVMSWEYGSFKFLEGATEQRTIETPWNFLIIEALRLKDENKAKYPDREPAQASVLVVDDSRFFVSRLRDFLQEQLAAEVAGEAANGREAIEFLAKSTPDLITLDINMPVMAGDVALKHIMIKSPAPVVLVSNFNERHAGKVMEFLRLGAVDFIAKPMGGQPWEVFAKRLAEVVRNASHFRIRNVRRARNPKLAVHKRDPGMPADKIIIVVGGYGALLEIQKILPCLDLMDRCGLVIFQQMCPLFASPAADYLEPHCAFSVKELGSGAPLLSNQAWLSAAKGKWRIKADESGAGIYSVGDEGQGFDVGEVLEVLSEIFSCNLAVVVLSGADVSIVEGLQHVAMSDGKIIAQLPDTSLYPMPLRQIDNMGLTTEFMAPEDIAVFLTKWITGSS